MAGSIEVRALGKRFRRYDRAPARTVRESLMRALRPSRVVERFWAVRDVTFDVAPGEMLGVIGHNGSGKSTLLRMIGGVMRPDAGTVKTRGRVSGLLELNTGMHPELSGRDNILIGGVAAGLTRREVSARMDEIIAFSELEASIDSPLRAYSSGMWMRLGFAVAVHTDPGVLLIDEVLSVGDLAFQAKCLDKIRQRRDEGSAIVLISHDMHQVQQLCSHALWMRGGEAVAYGEPELLVGEYRAAMASHTQAQTPAEVPDTITAAGTRLRLHENRWGSLDLRITRVALSGKQGLPAGAIEVGEPLHIDMGFEGRAPADPVVGVTISTLEGQDRLDVHTEADGVVLPGAGAGGGSVRLELDRLDLAPGRYAVSVGLYHPGWEYAYDYHWRAYPIEITGKVPPAGVISPPRRWVVG